MTKMKTEREKFKMKQGTTALIQTSEPAAFITGSGKYTYLWFGNDSPNSKACYATMSGPKTIETFAINILKSIGSKRLKK